MPHFISVLVSRENDQDNWIYAQEADSLAALERNAVYTSINQMPKDLFSASRANNRVRTIRDNFGLGAIQVVSFRGNMQTSSAMRELSETLGKRAAKKLFASNNS